MKCHRKTMSIRLSIVGIAFISSLVISGCSKETDIEHVARAETHMQQGDIRSAVIEYKSAIQLNNNNSEARLALAKIYLGVGDGKSAEKELRKTIAGGQVERGLLPLLLESYMLQGEFQTVIDKTNESTQVSGSDSSLLLAYRGEAFLGKGNIEEAEKNSRMAMEADPNNSRIAFVAARVAQASGNNDEARAVIKKILNSDALNKRALLLLGELEFGDSKYSDAEAAFQKVVDHEPKDILTLYMQQAQTGLVQSLIAQKKYDEAGIVAADMLRLAPKHPLSLYYSAVVAYEKGELDKAEKALLEVINMVPEHQQSLLLLGAIKFAKGQMEQADIYLDKFVNLAPTHIPGRKLLAATRMKLKQPGLAMEALDPLLENGGSADVAMLGLAGSASIHSGDVKVGAEYLKKALTLSPDNTSIRTELALAYLAESDIQNALKELETAAEKEGAGQMQASAILVLTHIRNNDFEKALKAANELIKREPKKSLPYNLLGAVYEASGDFGEAMAQYEKAGRIEPDNLQSMLNIARLTRRQGLLKEARSKYEDILVKYPKDLTVIMSLAEISERLGDMDKAVVWVNEAVSAAPDSVGPKVVLARFQLRKGQKEEAQALINEAYKLAPEDPEVLLTKGTVHMVFSEWEEARKVFEHLLALKPKSILGRYQLARIYIKELNIASARKVLNEVLDIKPDYIPAITLLANLEIIEGRASQAMELANKVKKQQPTTGLGYMIEGDVLFRQKKFQEALNAYEKAMAKADSQNNSQLAVKLFRARIALGKDAAAYSEIENWIADHPDALNMRLFVASSYRETGNLDMAEKYFQDVIDRDPKNVVALNDFAWVLNQKGNKRAIEVAEKAHTLAPDNGAVTDTYAWILVQNGELEKGSVLLKRAVSQAPNYPDIKYHLAVALAKMGNNEEAKSALLELLEGTRNNFASRKEAQSLLDTL